MKYLFLLLMSLLFSTTLLGETVLYNGESVSFSASAVWDQNGSVLSQKAIAPYSKPNHLRDYLQFPLLKFPSM